MPYNTFERDGRYCNHKTDPGGKPMGESLGCFDTRQEAREQVEALYASEEKTLIKSKPINASFSIQKDASGRSRWIAQFSNNVRDDDNPPEIISAEAHRRFAYMVDKGIVPPPELWIFHEEEWYLGEADWMAVDQYEKHAFIVASGYFHPDAEEVASALAAEKDVALSHGMYPHLIERDDPDQSIITGYVSREISVLPREMAANKLTAYTMENKMVKDDKRRSLAERWPNLGEELLSRIEQANASAKSVAEQLDLETKDATEVETEAETTEETSTESTEEVSEQETQETTTENDVEVEAETKSVSYAEVAELLGAIGARLESIEKAQATAVGAMIERIENIEEKEQAREKSSRGNTLAELFMTKSAEGKDETRVDGRTKLGKDSPAETKEKDQGLFFEEFLRN